MRCIPLSVDARGNLCPPVLVFLPSYWLIKNQECLAWSVMTSNTLKLLGIAIVVLG